MCERFLDRTLLLFERKRAKSANPKSVLFYLEKLVDEVDLVEKKGVGVSSLPFSIFKYCMSKYEVFTLNRL